MMYPIKQKSLEEQKRDLKDLELYKRIDQDSYLVGSKKDRMVENEME